MASVRRIWNKGLLQNARGGASVEFAILLPVWLFMFFGFLDYGWYLTQQVMLENAVAAGARAGVKTAYWLDATDDGYEDPAAISKKVVKNAFTLSGGLKDSQIGVTYLNKENEEVTNPDTEPFRYLKVAVSQLDFTPLVGYLPDAMIPEHVSAAAMTVFP